MIDTISLTIEEKDFKILDHNKFSPSTENLFVPPFIKVTARAPFKATNNPTKADKQQHGYLPRLTIFKALRRGGFTIFLKVEFSIPKLLHGNNFDEVEESDFGEICWKLKDLLFIMGVKIEDIQILANADVSTVHYSKNIVLTDYSTPYSILKEVSKINVNRLLDMNSTDFRNEGHSIKYHSNDFEVILYDKLKDLKQAKLSEKRAIEKDNYTQLSLFDQPQSKKPFEVLRVEVRIGSRRKMKQLLEKYSFKNKQLIFTDLYSKKLSKKLLLAIIKEIESSYPKLLMVETETFEGILTELQLNNPKLGYRKLLVYFGAKVALEEIGVRKFRKVTDRFGKTSWYRLNKEMKQLVVSKTKSPFKSLLSKLSKFEKVKLNKLDMN
ncbi:hypothetical protein JW796_02675 [Candidatus Dojkabacteria bacterium]|nr:hypothetical protein [Candidatus Dojkabacteria bacterium]